MRIQSGHKGFLGPPCMSLRGQPFDGTNSRLIACNGANAHQYKLVLGATRTDRRLLMSTKAWDLVLVVGQALEGGGLKGLLRLHNLREGVFSVKRCTRL